MSYIRTRKDVEQVILGNFKTISDKLRISDPCYSRETWCSGAVENAKIGSWLAYVLKSDECLWGKRIAELHAYHDDYANHLTHTRNWQPVDFEVGVDSGQVGIFDEEAYRGGTHDEWYDECCNVTLSSSGAGIILGGVVSSSGYGDGVYTAYTLRNEDAEIIGVKVVFIEPEEEVDEDDEDYA